MTTHMRSRYTLAADLDPLIALSVSVLYHFMVVLEGFATPKIFGSSNVCGTLNKFSKFICNGMSGTDVVAACKLLGNL